MSEQIEDEHAYFMRLAREYLGVKEALVDPRVGREMDSLIKLLTRAAHWKGEGQIAQLTEERNVYAERLGQSGARAGRASAGDRRRNCELFNDAHQAAELRIVELRATLARVRALPSRWRDEYVMGPSESFAAELEAALKGKP